MKNVLVCGAGGFIGTHLVKRLTQEGHRVRGVDIKYPEFEMPVSDSFWKADLRDLNQCVAVFDQPFDEVYQLAADMGGAGYVFTGENDAQILSNSCLINMNVLDSFRSAGCKRIFYSSSACVYPEGENPKTPEHTAYPAGPDSEYGWEKLFSERLYLAYARNYGIDVRIARYHNIFGPLGSWRGGKEKAPAAICRKVAEAELGDSIEIWGDGEQLRSFLYVDECVEGTLRLMRSDFTGPVNIGSEEMISINDLAKAIMWIASKNIDIRHVPGPLGVGGRNSDNALIREKLGWAPSGSLVAGLRKTYPWVASQVDSFKSLDSEGDVL